MAKLTKAGVDRIIRCARMKDDNEGYEANEELALLLTLMYYGPMKIVDALHLTKQDIEAGYYISKRRGKVELSFQREQLSYIETFKGDRLLTKTQQNYSGIFRKIARSERIEARLSDVYYLGEKENR